jgi:hypothetical protein
MGPGCPLPSLLLDRDKVRPEVEPTRGLDPRTVRLQGAKSVVTMAFTSDFNVYVDRSGRHSGSNEPEFASHVMSRRPRRRCDLQIDPLGHHGTGLRRHPRGQRHERTFRCVLSREGWTGPGLSSRTWGSATGWAQHRPRVKLDDQHPDVEQRRECGQTLLCPVPAAKDATGLDAHVGGDLPDGEHRAQTALASEPARSAAGVDELGVEAAAVGALVVLCAAVFADQDAGKRRGKWCWYSLPPAPGYDDAIIVAVALRAVTHRAGLQALVRHTQRTDHPG